MPHIRPFAALEFCGSSSVVKPHMTSLPDQVTIGRDAQSDLVCFHENLSPKFKTIVSRKHALIQWNSVDGFFEIEDLNTVNGTFLNNLRIPAGRKYPLQDKDVINCGGGSTIVSGTTANPKSLVDLFQWTFHVDPLSEPSRNYPPAPMLNAAGPASPSPMDTTTVAVPFASPVAVPNLNPPTAIEPAPVQSPSSNSTGKSSRKRYKDAATEDLVLAPPFPTEVVPSNAAHNDRTLIQGDSQEPEIGDLLAPRKPVVQHGLDLAALRDLAKCVFCSSCSNSLLVLPSCGHLACVSCVRAQVVALISSPPPPPQVAGSASNPSLLSSPKPALSSIARCSTCSKEVISKKDLNHLIRKVTPAVLKSIEEDPDKVFLDCLLTALVPDEHHQMPGIDSDERVSIGLHVPLLQELSRILNQPATPLT
jgi:FHA domain